MLENSASTLTNDVLTYYDIQHVLELNTAIKRNAHVRDLRKAREK